MTSRLHQQQQEQQYMILRELAFADLQQQEDSGCNHPSDHSLTVPDRITTISPAQMIPRVVIQNLTPEFRRQLKATIASILQHSPEDIVSSTEAMERLMNHMKDWERIFKVCWLCAGRDGFFVLDRLQTQRSRTLSTQS